MFENKECFFDAERYTIQDDQTSVSAEHRHSYHELYFLLDGDTHLFINNEIMDVSVGQCAFVWQGYIHKFTYNEKQRSHRLLIRFNSAFIGEEYVPMLRELRKRKRIDILPDAFSVLKEQLAAILYEKKNQDIHSLLQCQNLLRQVIILLCRQPELQQVRNISQNERIIQCAAQYISAHYSEKLSLQNLAQQFSMSESHFSRTFKEHTGIGVAQYIKHIRLRAAEKMLLQKAGSITEIAFACGFNNSNYFIHDFKKHHGITPLQYALNSQKE